MPPVRALAQQVAEKGVGGAVAAGLPRHNLSPLNSDWRREAAATPFFSNLSEMGPLREVHKLSHSCLTSLRGTQQETPRDSDDAPQIIPGTRIKLALCTCQAIRLVVAYSGCRKSARASGRGKATPKGPGKGGKGAENEKRY